MIQNIRKSTQLWSDRVKFGYREVPEKTFDVFLLRPALEMMYTLLEITMEPKKHPIEIRKIIWT